MATSLTFNVVNLGTAADLDTSEWGSFAENASALVGTTFDDLSPDDLQTVSPSTTYTSYGSYSNYPGGYGSYDATNPYGEEYFNLTDASGNVSVHAFDTMVEYYATITYADGSTGATRIFIMQDKAGNIWMAPPSSYGPQAASIDTSFQSIAITGVANSYIGGMYAAREVLTNIDPVPCFTRGTRIETDRGPVPVEDLQQGDMIATRDNGMQPLRWIGSRQLSARTLEQNENLRPIRIRSGALGAQTPSADLLVSPQHRVLVRSKIVQRMFEAEEVLVAAKQLCQTEGVDIAHDVSCVEYFHLLFDRHEVLTSNGAQTESLYTGPEALNAMDQDARAEIFALFPELAERDYRAVPARPLATGRMGRKLCVRHRQNRKALVSTAEARP